MSKGNIFENDLLKLIFNGTAIANMADNAASSPLTNLYVGLHTADPGEAGDQTTSEAAYTGYGRVAVARTSGGFTVTGSSVSPVANVDFGECTASPGGAITHFSIGTAASGAGKLLYKGPLGSALGPFSGATNDNITIPGLSGVAVSDRIAFYAAAGSSLPTGVSEGTVYYVKTVSSDVVTISATDGGSTVDLTASGDGVAYRVTPVSMAVGVIPRVKTTSTITED